MLVRVARPFNALRATLVGAMVGAFALALLTPAGRTFFALEVPPPDALLVAVALLVAFDLAWRLLRQRIPALHLDDDEGPAG